MQITSFLTRSVYERHHLHSSKSFAMRKIKPGKLTEETVEIDIKEQLKSLLQLITLEELAYIISKLNNLGLSDKELKMA